MAQASATTGGQLVAAFESGNEPAIRRLGWYPVWEAAATWWAPRQDCTAREFVPYAKLLGAEDPAAVVEALKALAGDWRPTPAQVYGRLHRARPDGGRVDVGRGRDRSGTPEALTEVAHARHAGGEPCSCDHRRPSWTRDECWVLRCAACGGLEWGQLFAAEDLGLLRAVA